MVPLRVFVSYTHKSINEQEKELAIRLLEDLRNAGVEIVTDDETLPEAQFFVLLQQELPRCQWFLLIQTAQSPHSLRTQVAMNHALQQLKRHEMEGILRVVCSSSETEHEPPQWSDTLAYPFNGDYPRLRDKVLLDLNLLQIEDVINKRTSKVMTGELLLPEAADSNTSQSLPDEGVSIPSTDPDNIARSGDRPNLATTSATPSFLARLWKKKPETNKIAQNDTSPSISVSHNDRPMPLPNQKKPHPLQSRALLIALILLVVVVASSSILLTYRPQPPHPSVTPTPVFSKIPTVFPATTVYTFRVSAKTRSPVKTPVNLVPGDRFIIKASGTAAYCTSCPPSINPDGMGKYSGLARDSVYPSAPVGTLLGSIGQVGTQGSSAWFVVGSNYSSIASARGPLYLVCNDDIYADNKGFYSVTVVVEKW